MMKIAIVVSRFNTEVTGGLLQGAQRFFATKNINEDQIDVFYVPGSFEIPIVAKRIARTKKYSGIVCLGAIIKGETAHFEFVSLGATMGIMDSMLETETPMAFGVLTTYNDEEAVHRAQNNESNKGWEAASACYETIELLEGIGSPKGAALTGV